MRVRLHCAGLVLLSLPLFVGCASFRAGFNEALSKESSEQYQSVDRHSSYPVLRRENFEQVNLLEMIDPEHKSSGLQSWDVRPEAINYGRRYDLTLAWFRNDGQPDEQKRLTRDGVQDKIIAVSTSRCNVFKTYLRRQQTDVNFTLGSLTTAAGVLGAILPGATASRNLAGTAGLFSGLQAEYNQAYFSNLAAHVIVQAIELRQNRLKKELMDGRKDKGIKAYSMEAAINDAIVIDGSCSALAGLMEAQDSIKEVETPGLRMAARAMTSARALQELNAKPISELQASGSLASLMALAGGNVPSLLVTSGKATVGGPLGIELVGAANVADAILRQVDLQAGRVGAAFEALQKKAAEGQRSKLGAAAVSAEFRSVVAGKLGLTGDQLAERFKTCAINLKTAAGQLGTATSELSAVQGDAAEATQANYARDIAEAKVKLVLAQTSAVKAGAQAQVDAAASSAITNLPSAESLQPFSKEQLTAAFKDLTVDVGKIGADCK